MAEITLPEVKLPDIKLPDGLREMSRDDIVQAAKDIHLPKKLEFPDLDLSKANLPKQVTDRLPGRRRTNPILPIAAFLAVGAAIAAAWYLITSPVTGPRIRVAVNDLRSRVTGERTDLVRYDDDKDLGSLLPERDQTSTDFGNGSTLPDLPTAKQGTPEQVGTTY
ncbi:MAG TPA: hypothetical protein VFO73_03330 [Candidatus Limnocylindrales bacterium]|nr:hypothetical protein [Candidatus Limnocylindrales bacterium]